MSTVGFEEVRPLSELGRVFSMVIIITGVGAFAYTFATLGEQLISGQLVSNLRQRGTAAMLRRLRGHHIVVGYGNTGSAVAAQLRAVKGARVVVIETDASLVRDASEDGCTTIHGDAGSRRGVGASRDRERGEPGLCGFSGFGNVDDGVDGPCDGAGSEHRCTCDVAGFGFEVAACRGHEGSFGA